MTHDRDILDPHPGGNPHPHDDALATGDPRLADDDTTPPEDRPVSGDRPSVEPPHSDPRSTPTDPPAGDHNA